MEAELHDGTILEFPDGTDPAVIQTVVKRHLASAVSPLEEHRPDLTGVQFPVNVDSTPSSLDKAGNVLAKLPALRGTPPYRVMQGMADPGLAAIQMGAHALGHGEAIDSRLQAIARKTNDQRGSSGFDPYRLAGNIAITAPLAGGTATGSLLARALQSASTGARFGLLNPVETPTDNFLSAKVNQGALGAAGGVGGLAAGNALGAIAKPTGNAIADALRAKGIEPTIGQHLGGGWNALEEKLQSVPLLGDAISAARNRARDQFNNSTINEAIAPIGQQVEGLGHAAVNAAHNAVSDAYQAALGKIKGVFQDAPMATELGTLKSEAQNMVPMMAQKFDRALKTIVEDRLSPTGGIEANTYKGIDSELGTLAQKWNSSALASEKELGGALMEAKAILSRAAMRQNPEQAPALQAADAAFARMVRVENAAKAAKGNNGIFTPGQLLSGVQQADRSIRDNATARGTALMQDVAGPAQQVLGNRVADSGTTGRALASALTLGSTAAMPIGTLAALGGGAALYAPQAQRLITALATKRPAIMQPIAQALRQYGPAIGAFAAPRIVGAQ